MKQILIEIDDRCARDLARVAPVKKRIRAEFIRLAIQRAIDLALDRETEAAYRLHPLDGGLTASDLEGWDVENTLAEHGASAAKSRKNVKEVASKKRGRKAV